MRCSRTIVTNFDNDFGFDSSDSGAPEPIPHREFTPVPKPKPSQGTEVEIVVKSSTAASKQPRKAPVEDEDKTHPKRRRSTRHQGHKPLIYNTHYHPADDVLHPSKAARLKASDEQHLQELSSDTGDDDTFEAAQDAKRYGIVEGCSEPIKVASSRSPVPNRRRSSRNPGRLEAPNYDMRYVHRGRLFELLTEKT